MIDSLLNETPPYTNKKSARPTATQGFRIYQDQIDTIKRMFGSGTSEAMRLILDEFINGRMPNVRIKLLKKGLIK